MAIIEIRSGNIKSSSSMDFVEKGKHFYFDRSSIRKIIKSSSYKGEFIIIPSEGNIIPQYINGSFSHHQKTYRLRSKQNLTKYLYYYIMNHLKQITNLATGTTVQRINSDMWIDFFYKAQLPFMQEQQKIIDIIEPIERQLSILKKLNKNLIKLISLYGSLSICDKGEKIPFTRQKEKYASSGWYLPTAKIKDFINEYDEPDLLDEIPSRGRLKFLKNILYTSKLEGERKILYSSKDKDIIISNGMWGISANQEVRYTLFAYLLSNDFYSLKKITSTGTTMIGLNNEELNSIIQSKNFSFIYNNQLKKMFNQLSLNSELIYNLEKHQKILINLLIK